MFTTIITFVAVLSLLVFVHEFGHFITAKKSGIRVDEFGFGFPPRIFGIKRGGTVYSVNWIPLGGFVRIKGEGGEHGNDKDSFANKSGWVRLLVLTAGVVMNVVLAWFLFSVGYVVGMPQVVEDLPQFARVTQGQTQVLDVMKGSPAELAGMKTGDALLTVDGQPVTSVEGVRSYTQSHEGQSIRVTFKQNDQTLTKDVTPVRLAGAEQAAMGVALVRTGMVSYPIWYAPVQGAVATWVMGREIVLSFGSLIRDLFVKHAVTVDLSGPIGIAVITSEVAARGFRYLIQFTALLSLNLAVINILPFPALDGGRVLFLAIERARGRAVSRNIENLAHNVGFALLMLVVIFVTIGDFRKFSGGMLQGLSRFFTGG